MRRQLRRARKLSMELESLDRNNNNGDGSSSRSESEDNYLSSDAAECSLMPPPTSRNGTKNNAASSPSPAGDINSNNSAARKKWKGENRINNQVGKNGSETSSSPLQQNSPKTLFSAVMSLSNTNHPPPQDDALNDGAGIAATTSFYNNVTTTAAVTAPSLENKTINTETPQKSSKGKNKTHKSPMFSPGGYEILKALDGANSYAYLENESGDVMESDEDGRLAEEWQDATIYFNDEFSRKINNAILENVMETTTEDLTDGMDAEKYHDRHPLLESSIVEATKHASDRVNIKQCTKNNLTIPEPIGVGVLDWSLKRRLRLECVPGRCLPQSLSSPSSSCSLDEGFLHHLALQYLSNNDDSGRTWSHRNHACSRDVLAMAKWLASIMYYQHPAVHPLPPSMLSSKDVAMTKSKRDLSSFLVGPHSIHNRVRLPAAGCMGGLGISVIPSDRIGKAIQIDQHEKRSNNNDKSSIATVPSLLHQRRRDWQEAFRSMFHSWKSKLKRLQASHEDAWSQIDQGSTTPVQDDVYRCSFYAILPHQVILFRLGYIDDANDDAASRIIVPMVVFSSTTVCLRSKLNSMGVNLRVFAKNNHDDLDKRKDCVILFSESLLDTTDNGVASTEGDAESVQSDLEVMKLENNDKDQVRVEVKKRNQHQKVGKPRSVDSPPLFVCGEDDCATVYELLMNTYGLSVGLEIKLSKGGIESVSLDVPLLLCRSLGPCMHTTLRTLSFSSRRDCGYLSQVQIDASNFLSQRDDNSIAKAALELRGPILPCALRDMTCAVVNFMMLDMYRQDQSCSSHLNVGDHLPDNMDDKSNFSSATSSYQFLLSLQAHEGEFSRPTPKSTGSSSSTEFNGSIPIPLTLRQFSDNGPAAWRQCGHGEYLDKLVWDISRNSVVSFHASTAAP